MYTDRKKSIMFLMIGCMLLCLQPAFAGGGKGGSGGGRGGGFKGGGGFNGGSIGRTTNPGGFRSSGHSFRSTGGTALRSTQAGGFDTPGRFFPDAVPETFNNSRGRHFNREGNFRNLNQRDSFNNRRFGVDEHSFRGTSGLSTRTTQAGGFDAPGEFFPDAVPETFKNSRGRHFNREDNSRNFNQRDSKNFNRDQDKFNDNKDRDSGRNREGRSSDRNFDSTDRFFDQDNFNDNKDRDFGRNKEGRFSDRNFDNRQRDRFDKDRNSRDRNRDKFRDKDHFFKDDQALDTFSDSGFFYNPYSTGYSEYYYVYDSYPYGFDQPSSTYNTYNYYSNPLPDTDGKIKAEPSRTRGPDKEKGFFADGVRFFGNGDYIKAAEKFKTAMSYVPHDRVLPFAYAQALFAGGDYISAAAAVREAVAKVNPETDGIFFARGMYPNNAVLEQNLVALNRAVLRSSSNASLQLLLGYNQLGLGRLDEARQNLTNAADDPTNLPAATSLLKLVDKLQIKQKDAPAEQSTTGAPAPQTVQP